MVSGHRCDACDSVGTAVPRLGDEYLVLCDDCWGSVDVPAAREPDCREPVLLSDVLAGAADALAHAARTGRAVPDARSTGSTTCDTCGGQATWHRTVRGRWIMIEPGELPVGSVPPGKRWRIAGDGTAVNLGPASPSDTCRVCHFDVCPTRPAPLDSPVLLALWRKHARRGA
ncbi:DUF6083 domain-containing protein [Streptomyces sp. NBC_01353]|uniref:DUF6083 domain-containing protein n=1 Tax=Streptomyces sp. NBC_01353 TaxID=2903835 RepID=UPI002E364A38|nr:DUF6083 domain-containing protein [Streptomyces sp. NBC_01353]